MLLPSILFAKAGLNNPVSQGITHVKNWQYLHNHGVVRQNFDFSCGAASIATLLNGFYGQHLTEKDILEKMDKTKVEASFLDMQHIMPKLGFQAKGYAVTFEQLEKLKIPVIVYLKYRKNDHFSVLRGINTQTVLLADPSFGNITLSKSQFLNSWKTRQGQLEGKILAILPNNNSTKENTRFFTNNPKRQTQLATQIIRNQPDRLPMIIR